MLYISCLNLWENKLSFLFLKNGCNLRYLEQQFWWLCWHVFIALKVGLGFEVKVGLLRNFIKNAINCSRNFLLLPSPSPPPSLPFSYSPCYFSRNIYFGEFVPPNLISYISSFSYLFCLYFYIIHTSIFLCLSRPNLLLI